MRGVVQPVVEESVQSGYVDLWYSVGRYCLVWEYCAPCLVVAYYSMGCREGQLCIL